MENNFTQKKAKYFKLLSIGTVAIIGAIEDYGIAIKLFPKFSSAYNNRGVAKYDLGDKKGALQDYTTAIQLDPSAVSYYNRASTRDDLDDKNGAIADYQEAARLYKKEGNTKKYSEILETVRVIKSFLPN
jgi:tetratricopeptide (TPR) repeat protein